MAISEEDFRKRLREMPVETEADRNLYTPAGEGRFNLQIGQGVVDRVVQLLPVDLGGLDAEEIAHAANPPLWQNGHPICTNPPPSYDNLHWQTDPPKDQLDRTTCVAFTAVACLEALLRRTGKDLNLSEQYTHWLFMKNLGQSPCSNLLRTTLASRFLSAKGSCPTAQASYQSSTTLKCTDPAFPPQATIDRAIYSFGNYWILNRSAPAPGGLDGPSVGNTDYLECLVSQGKDVVLQVDIAWGLPRPDGTHHVIITDPATGQPRAPYGTHAMLLVGYVHDAYFLFKNSWRDAPNGVIPGYLQLSYCYVRQYARFGFVVDQAHINTPSPFALLTGHINNFFSGLKKIFN